MKKQFLSLMQLRFPTDYGGVPSRRDPNVRPERDRRHHHLLPGRNNIRQAGQAKGQVTHHSVLKERRHHSQKWIPALAF